MPRYSGSVGKLMRRDGASVVEDASPRDLAILLALLNANEAAAFLDRSDARAAAAAERVEREVAGSGDEGDEVTHERDGLDGGVGVALALGKTDGALAGRGLSDIKEPGSAA